MGITGIELVGWDDTRCRPIYQRNKASVSTVRQPSLSEEDENENRNTNKSKIRIEMNHGIRVSSLGRDMASELSAMSSSSLNDGRGEGPTMATKQTKLEIVVGTIKTVDCGTIMRRRRKAQTLSLLPPHTGCGRNATGVQEVVKKKRAYGAIKPVESGVQIIDSEGARLRLGWDEVKCRPIYEYLPRNRQNDVKSPSSATTTKTKTVTHVHHSHDDDEHAHDDIFHKKRITTQKKRVYATHFRKKTGLSRAVVDEMEIHSPTSIQ